MKSIVIIPSRLDSTRFPNKPMALIHGIPMIGHCYYRSSLCKEISGSYVATPDRVIYDYIKKIGGNAIMTSSKHTRASDRTAEALKKIEKNIGKIDIVIMLQGDEPMITPKMIEKSILLMKKDRKIEVINFISSINSIKELNDPNEIKVLKDINDNAIYFSRLPIPFNQVNLRKQKYYKQVCIIPFTRTALLEFNRIKESYLEKMESIDMLRLLENNKKVKLIYNKDITYSIDNKNDLKNVIMLMKNDQYLSKYGKKI